MCKSWLRWFFDGSKKAIEQVISETGIKDYSQLNERRVVEVVAMNDLEAWKKQRFLKLLESGFGFGFGK